MKGKVTVKGFRAHGRLYISGLGKDVKKIPPYFTIEIDLDTIKEREKEK